VSGVNKVVFNHDASSSMLFDLIIESIARRIDQTSLCIKTFHCGFWSSSTKKKKKNTCWAWDRKINVSSYFAMMYQKLASKNLASSG
jgi:hypothetical protein